MAAGIVIVGAGQAGARAAEALRKEGYSGSVRLIGTESHAPYERPHLSKEYLSGHDERGSLFVHDQSWYADQSIDLLTSTTVIALDAGAHSITLHNGVTLGYDALLLATGSEPRRLTVRGRDLAGVFYLRTIDDADRLRAALLPGGARVLVVGGGWIGLESAAVARTLGNEVTVLAPGDVVLGRALGMDAGSVFAAMHRDQGVHLLMGEGLASLEGAAGHVALAATTSGRRLEVDAVIVGIGAVPRSDLAAVAGIRVDNGVVVDASLRSSHEGVFAAGDIARAYHPLFGQHIRVEHWDTARMMSRAAARAMLGQEVSYDRIPYFYTDQYDLSMEYTGYIGADGYDEFVWRGQPLDGPAIGFWLRGGRLLAGMSLDVPQAMKPIEALIRGRVRVPVRQLIDDSVPLEALHPRADH